MGWPEDAAAAYERGHYATAERLYRPPPEKGDGRAQLSLGMMYEHGQVGMGSFSEAVKLYRRAAQQG
jgi:TPR repeat protein